MYLHTVQNHIKRRDICVPAQQHIDSNIGTVHIHIVHVRIYIDARAENGEVEVHMDVYGVQRTMYIDKLCIFALVH